MVAEVVLCGSGRRVYKCDGKVVGGVINVLVRWLDGVINVMVRWLDGVINVTVRWLEGYKDGAGIDNNDINDPENNSLETTKLRVKNPENKKRNFQLSN